MNLTEIPGTSSTETRVPTERLPRGPHKLSRETVAASQRARLLRAFTELLAERHYSGLRIGDLVGRAGVSRATFYEQFGDKEACLLAAFEHWVADVIEAMTAPLEPDTDAARRIRTLLTRYLACLDHDRVATLAFYSEMAAAGPAARRRRREVTENFAAFIALQHAAVNERDPAFRPLPDQVYLALALAVRQLVAEHLQTDPDPALLDLVEPLTILFTAALSGDGRAP